MKNLLLILFISFVFLTVSDAQVTGLWKSTDHIDETERSVVLIYEKNGKLYGRIERLLPAATVTHCTGCEGDLKNKSLTGMVIITDLNKNGDAATGGKILDPSNGKWYSCDIELESADKLKVTGYIGLPLLGKAMYWNRVK
ncbi:MAG: DUF2147 domain-containing protein [Saprospiraceae bacterium]|nr:DUF2147 domain-containing protein [Candidatus Opimibacter iunctus]